MYKELPEQRQGRISGCSVSNGITTGQHLTLAEWSNRKQGHIFYLDRRAEKWQVRRHRGAIVLIEMKWEGLRGDKVVRRERKRNNFFSLKHCLL